MLVCVCAYTRVCTGMCVYTRVRSNRTQFYLKVWQDFSGESQIARPVKNNNL